MAGTTKIWEDFLTSVIKNTFGEFINSEEIDNRVKWILGKIHSIPPEKLFKSILFMMNNNPLSKMAIGFKLRFLEDDYKDVFTEPYTEEFDRNDSLEDTDKTLVTDLVNKFAIAVNHHIEIIIANDNSIDDLSEAINQLTAYYNLPNLESMDNKMIREGDLVYFMEFGQLLYMVVFNQNPLNGNPCSDDTASMVNERFPKRVKAMETLKVRWPTGIPLKYVKSSNIF